MKVQAKVIEIKKELTHEDIQDLIAYNEKLIRLVQGWGRIGERLKVEIPMIRKEMQQALTVLKFSTHEGAFLELEAADKRLAALLAGK